MDSNGTDRVDRIPRSVYCTLFVEFAIFGFGTIEPNDVVYLQLYELDEISLCLEDILYNICLEDILAAFIS